MCRIALFVSFMCAVVLLCSVPAVLSAQEPSDRVEMIYGPGIEVGVGVGADLEGEARPWNADRYNMGIITAAMRIFQGLSVQGGLDYGRGRNSEADTLTYGDYRLKLNKKTFLNSYWAGVRYEVPMSMIGRDIMGIHSVYCAAGMAWADYGVKSSEGSYRGESFTNDNVEQFKVARLTGPYFMVAARWRIDRPDKETTNTLWGSYGVDFGVRYSKLGDHTLEYPNIPAPSGDYTSTQIFLAGFVKIRLFE